ncbi:hypothetical protein EG68_05144 [Paragonimus skrjabini miyazakii]|uniref:Uncharacterized protein n=1 Tax=Paragonimus skrjabini miyazakii TaxID=59628 RepID=A0A8S9YX65_9TREM|nr:hypothetical protein EG68_05144 [Paragonimus skrjabini miyazakii]
MSSLSFCCATFVTRVHEKTCTRVPGIRV